MEQVDSLWAATAAPATLSPTLTDEVRTDVTVVGGGFTGLSTALHLAEAGREVVLVEAQDIGHGASGRNGGQVNPGLKHGEAELAARFGEPGRAFYRMGQEAPDFLADLVARKKIDCGLVRPGLIRLAHNARSLATLRSAGETLRREGVPVEDLDAEAVRRRVGTGRYPGGLYDPRGAQVQPLDLARGMARAAQEAGARIFTRSPATTLTRDGAGWHLTAGAGSVRAREIVVATNAYTDGLVPGLARSVLPVNSFQVATAPLPDHLADRLIPGGETVYDSRRLVIYFRKSADRRIVLGGRATFTGAQGIGQARADYSVLERALRGIFPELENTPVEKRWTGLVCITMDHLPHYHRPEPSLHVLLGFNGRGVAMSHRAGAWLARQLAGLPDPCAIPETPIRPVPFHAFRAPMLDLAMRWNRVLDAFGR